MKSHYHTIHLLVSGEARNTVGTEWSLGYIAGGGAPEHPLAAPSEPAALEHRPPPPRCKGVLPPGAPYF